MLVVCLAAGVVVYDRPLTPFDAALPIVAAALLLFSWIARVQSLEVAPIALLVVAIAFANDAARLIAYGAIISIVFAAAVLSALREGTFDRRDAISLAIAAMAILRLIPLEGRRALVELVVFGGIAALLLASSFRERVPLAAFGGILIVALLTPADPPRAALLPLLLTACCWFLRGGGVLALAAALPLAILGGRWALPIALAAIAMRLLEERGAPRSIRWLFAAGLVALGAFVRPSIAILYLASGVVLSVNRNDSRLPGAALLGYACAATLLIGWSGALIPGFPVPITPLQLALAGGLLLLMLIPDGRLVAIPAAVLFVVAISSFEPRLPERHPVEVSLAAGEPLEIPIRHVRGVDLVISGANISELPRGSALGTIEVLTEHGGGFRRDVRVGDVADWGAFREGHRFRTRNPLPQSIAAIHGSGVNAYPSGAGVLHLSTPEKIALIRVTADRSLPPNARLQVESFEER